MFWRHIFLVSLLGFGIQIHAAAQGTVTTDNLTLRAKPTAKSAELGSLDKGATVNVISKHGDWYKLELKSDMPVWVSSDLVVDGKIRVDRANLRSEPSTKGAVVGRLTKNTAVEVLDKSTPGWLKIKSPAGKTLTAYVHGKYVKLEKESSVPTANPSAGNNPAGQSTVSSSKTDFSELREFFKGQKPREVTIIGYLSPVGKGNEVLGIRYTVWEDKGSKDPAFMGFLFSEQKLEPFEGKKLRVRAHRYTIEGWKEPVFEVITIKEQK